MNLGFSVVLLIMHSDMSLTSVYLICEYNPSSHLLHVQSSDVMKSSHYGCFSITKIVLAFDKQKPQR